MELRELTMEEENILSKIKLRNEYIGAQILLGLVVLDSFDENKLALPILYNDICSRFNIVNDNTPICIEWILIEWIKQFMFYGDAKQDNSNQSKLEKTIDDLSHVFINTVCDVNIGPYMNKKQRDCGNFFNDYNKKIFEQYGVPIHERPRELMKFIVSSLDFYKFHRSNNKIVNIPVEINVEYEDYC